MTDRWVARFFVNCLLTIVPLVGLVVGAPLVRTAASTVLPSTVLTLRSGYNYGIVSYPAPTPYIGALTVIGKSKAVAKGCVSASVVIVPEKGSIPFELGAITYRGEPCNLSPNSPYFAVPVYSAKNGANDASTVSFVAIVGTTLRVSNVAMRYTESSDTQVQFTESDGYLWVYDCLAVGDNELLRVQQEDATPAYTTVAMPRICRPSISANAQQFTLRPGFESATIGSATMGIYVVSVQADHAVLLAKCQPEESARWSC